MPGTSGDLVLLFIRSQRPSNDQKLLFSNGSKDSPSSGLTDASFRQASSKLLNRSTIAEGPERRNRALDLD